MSDAEVMSRVERILDGFELGVRVDELRIAPLEGGASNENFLVDSGSERWVFRLAAPPTLSERFGLNRWSGFAAHQRAAGIGIAPEVRAIVLPAGHTLVDFIEGETLDGTTIFDGTNLEDAATALRAIHTAAVQGCAAFNGFVEIERFMRFAHEERLRLPADIEELLALSGRVEEVYREVGVPDVLCHNDVQIQNLIRDRAQRLWIIDWEYAGVGNPYFDLAMLVNNAGLDREQTDRVLRSYFGVAREADYARVELSRFQSAMREALWSVVAEPVLATGWDYQQWAERFFASARSIQTRIVAERLLEVAGAAPDDDIHLGRLRKHDE